MERVTARGNVIPQNASSLFIENFTIQSLVNRDSQMKAISDIHHLFWDIGDFKYSNS